MCWFSQVEQAVSDAGRVADEDGAIWHALIPRGCSTLQRQPSSGAMSLRTESRTWAQ
jgi:hypothetical protein